MLDIAGPVDEMDAPTIAMFKRMQSVLSTYARGWHEATNDVADHESEVPSQPKHAAETPNVLFQPVWNQRVPRYGD